MTFEEQIIHAYDYWKSMREDVFHLTWRRRLKCWLGQHEYSPIEKPMGTKGCFWCGKNDLLDVIYHAAKYRTYYKPKIEKLTLEETSDKMFYRGIQQ